jgi:Protein of unknown function (DUF1573)
MPRRNLERRLRREETMPVIDPTHTNRRHLGAILTLLLVVLAVAAPLAAAETPTPVPATVPLAAVEPTFDLGTLVKGETVVHTFVLKNTGKEPLTIERVAPSCGCTVAEFDATIPPGGEGKVHVDLHTKTLNGVGSVNTEVYVKGHTAPAAVLVLKFNVVSKLLAKPGYARWIYVQHEPQGTVGQTVYAGDGADFEVLSVKSPMPAITVTFREAKPEERIEGFKGRQWRIEPTLAQTAPVGAIVGFIDVETTHPRQKQIQIPVSGFVRPTIFVEPDRADFGTLTLSGPRHAVFQVRNFASQAIALTGAETDVPGISAQVQPVEQGRKYKVLLVLDPAAMKEGPFAGKLRVKTDSPKVPTLTVDFAGTLVRQTAEKNGA